jgi:hypothetical protein
MSEVYACHGVYMHVTEFTCLLFVLIFLYILFLVHHLSRAPGAALWLPSLICLSLLKLVLVIEA